jgi:hypothetical protein
MALELSAHTQPLRHGRRSSRQVVASRMVAMVAWKVSGVNRPGAAIGVDLGGSSKYSSEILED